LRLQKIFRDYRRMKVIRENFEKGIQAQLFKRTGVKYKKQLFSNN